MQHDVPNPNPTPVKTSQVDFSMKVVVFRLSSPPWEAYALKAMSSSASVENAVPSKQTTCKMFSLLNILGGPLDGFIERFSDSPS